MRAEQFIAIILILCIVMIICSVILYINISDRLDQLDDIENKINNIKKALVVSKESSTPRPYVGDAILTDAHGDTWHGQLRKTNKVKAGYSFEPYSDGKSCKTCMHHNNDDGYGPICQYCFHKSHWEGRE